MLRFITIVSIAAGMLGASPAQANRIEGFSKHLTGDRVDRIDFGTNAMRIDAECHQFGVYEYGSDAAAGAFYGEGINTPHDSTRVSYDKFISPGWYNFTEGHFIDFIFDEPVGAFGFTTVDLLEKCVDSNAYLSLIAFDERGKIIDAHYRRGPQGVSGVALDWQIGVEEQYITRARLIGNLWTAAAGGYDDFFISAEPGPVVIPLAPATALAAIPLTCIGLRRRRAS